MKTKMKSFKIISLMIAFALTVASMSAQKNEPIEIERLNKDIKRYPTSADAYLGRAREYVRLSRLESAIADFTKAIELSTHPYYISVATLDRGAVYIKQGKYALAIADFTTIVELKTAAVYKAQAYRNRADAYHRNGDHRTALADIDKAIALSSKSRSTGWKERLAKAYSIRASIYCRLGDKAAAAADEKSQAGFGLKVSDKCSPK